VHGSSVSGLIRLGALALLIAGAVALVVRLFPRRRRGARVAGVSPESTTKSTSVSSSLALAVSAGPMSSATRSATKPILSALGLSDTILHFFYNAIAYAGVVYAYVLVVPAGSPLASAKRPPTLKEIVLQPVVGFNHCSAMDHVESQLASTGRAPNIVFRSDNNGTVQGLVGAGVGVAVSPRLTVDEDDPSIEVIDLQGRVPARVIGLVWHSDRHRSAAAEAFVESAVEVCRQLSSETAAAA